MKLSFFLSQVESEEVMAFGYLVEVADNTLCDVYIYIYAVRRCLLAIN